MHTQVFLRVVSIIAKVYLLLVEKYDFRSLPGKPYPSETVVWWRRRVGEMRRKKRGDSRDEAEEAWRQEI